MNFLLLFLALAQPVDNQQRERLRAGAALLQKGQTDDAIRELRAGIAMNSRVPEAHLLLGQAYLAKQSVTMFAEAQAEFRQALDLDPRQVLARFYLAKTYIDLGRNEKAREQLQAALEINPNASLMLGLLGEVERKLGKPDLSIELNRKALSIDPAMTPCHYHIALALIDLKRDDEALKELETAAQSKFVTPDMFVTLSSLYQKQKRMSDAERAAKQAVTMDPMRAEGHLAMARLYNLRGASDKALDEVRLAMPEGLGRPSSPYFQQVRADVYFEQGVAYQAKRSVKEAIEALEKSLEFDPNRVEAHKRLAELYGRQKNAAKAAEHEAAAGRTAKEH